MNEILLLLQVSRDDKLPKKICNDCVCKVESFYEFWNTTANSEKQLLQWLGDAGDMGDKQEYIQVLNTVSIIPVYIFVKFKMYKNCTFIF